MSSSATRKPTLCGVRAYCEPGLPSPTTNQSTGTALRPGSFTGGSSFPRRGVLLALAGGLGHVAGVGVPGGALGLAGALADDRGLGLDGVVVLGRHARRR